MANAVLLGRFWEHVHMFVLDLVLVSTRSIGFVLPLVVFSPEHHVSVCALFSSWLHLQTSPEPEEGGL